MNLIKILSISLFALALAAGEATLPSAIQSILDKAEAQVQKNRAEYDKANMKPLADAEKSLKAELDKLTKAGKLEDAMAAKKALEGLRESLVAGVDEKAKQKGNLLGDNTLTIISAKYGIEGKQIDITKLLKSKIVSGVLNFANDDSTNGVLDDPAPGATKSIIIVYTLDGGKTRLTGTFPKHTPVKIGE